MLQYRITEVCSYGGAKLDYCAFESCISESTVINPCSNERSPNKIRSAEVATSEVSAIEICAFKIHFREGAAS